MASIAWEKLNTGYYEEVDEAWRVFYTVIMMCRAVRLKLERRIEVSIFVADLILMMLTVFDRIIMLFELLSFIFQYYNVY